jgi:hypothetical protein
VATASGYVEWNLLRELLASPQCIEVHLSGNDGSADQHHALDVDAVPWWWSLLACVNPDAVIFSEGRQAHRQSHDVDVRLVSFISVFSFYSPVYALRLDGLFYVRFLQFHEVQYDSFNNRDTFGIDKRNGSPRMAQCP